MDVFKSMPSIRVKLPEKLLRDTDKDINIVIDSCAGSRIYAIMDVQDSHCPVLSTSPELSALAYEQIFGVDAINTEELVSATAADSDLECKVDNGNDKVDTTKTSPSTTKLSGETTGHSDKEFKTLQFKLKQVIANPRCLVYPLVAHH